MGPVRVFEWNPSRPVLPGRLGRRLPLRRPVNNFGDLLGPLVVQRLLRARGIDPGRSRTTGTLFSVGSVLHFAITGDVVWGTGRNGKEGDAAHDFTSLDVRAVRGPLTRDFLRARGIEVPEVYGDPALLLPGLMPELVAASKDKQHAVTIVPNLNDMRRERLRGPQVLDPTSPVLTCLNRIAQSALVVGSSLHGIVVAEALGIPARLVVSGSENVFKYDDYYRGTGRTNYTAAETNAAAIAMGGETGLDWSPDPLLEAFPADLWTDGATAAA